MAKGFTLDTKELERALRRSPEAAGRGARQALDDIKDDWVRHARDIAPLNSTNLRREIDGDVEGDGLDSEVIITANATSSSNGKEFNYAYYIHEGHMREDGKQLRHPGTVEAFLDESGEKRQDEWQQILEEEIAEALRRAGW